VVPTQGRPLLRRHPSHRPADRRRRGRSCSMLAFRRLAATLAQITLGPPPLARHGGITAKPELSHAPSFVLRPGRSDLGLRAFSLERPHRELLQRCKNVVGRGGEVGRRGRASVASRTSPNEEPALRRARLKQRGGRPASSSARPASSSAWPASLSPWLAFIIRRLAFMDASLAFVGPRLAFMDASLAFTSP
jgi:hypothetical protein